MATISDVAKKAGVGTTTVSRVLNDSSKVSEETRKKIMDAINELNYHPSTLARGLASYSTYTIGLIMDNTMDKVYANPFIYEVFRGIEKSVYEGGYNLLLLGKNTYQNGKLAVENVLQGRMVDGLILHSNMVTSEYFEDISGYGLPIVTIGKIANEMNLSVKVNVSSVDIDNIMAGYKAAEYLYERGYKNIAFNGIEPDKVFANDRYMGYKNFMEEKELYEIIPDGYFSNIDSIICLDNIYAYKVLQKCRKLNKKIPEDIGIITFDNYPLAEYLEPPITNVDIDLYDLGVQAGIEILRKVKEKRGDSRQIKIPVSINIRSSTR